MHHSMLSFIISCTRSWNYAWRLLWCSTTESKNIVKLLAISQTIHTMCCEDIIISQRENLNQKVCFLLQFVRHGLSVGCICDDNKCCVVTYRGAKTRIAWLVYLDCLCSHILHTYCNFESKQANSITLFGQCPNYNQRLLRLKQYPYCLL